MSQLDIARKTVSFVSGLGVSQIVAGVVANTTPTDTVYQKVTVRTGGFVIGYFIGDWIDRRLEEEQIKLQAWWHENITTKA